MDNQYINNNLADFMLSLLSLPENEVSKIIKFMDEMPGGFFIYHADDDDLEAVEKSINEQISNSQ